MPAKAVKRAKVIVIVGPTASGKTSWGVRLARHYDGEIISADSRQVYRGLDIGSGKDKKSYRTGGRPVAVHLLDIASPRTEVTVARYQRLAYTAIDDVVSRGKTPMIVGGTGLYVSAVVEGYRFPSSSKTALMVIRRRLARQSLSRLLATLRRVDSATYKIIDKKNRRRVQRAIEIYYSTGQPKSQQLAKQPPPYDFLILGVSISPQRLRKNIEQRLDERLRSGGLAAEVRRLHRQGVSWRRLEAFGLEYRWLAHYLQKKISQEDMTIGLLRDVQQFAKRQLTWWRPKVDVIWCADYPAANRRVRQFLKKKE